VSPWLITTTAWSSLTLRVALSFARSFVHPVALGAVVMGALVVGCGALMRLRARIRAGRGSPS
jgi:hypothetical protein